MRRLWEKPLLNGACKGSAVPLLQSATTSAWPPTSGWDLIVSQLAKPARARGVEKLKGAAGSP